MPLRRDLTEVASRSHRSRARSRPVREGASTREDPWIRGIRLVGRIPILRRNHNRFLENGWFRRLLDWIVDNLLP